MSTSSNAGQVRRRFCRPARSLSAFCDLRFDAMWLLLSENEKQSGLPVVVQHGEFALEVDHANEQGVELVGGGVGGSAAAERSALLPPVSEADPALQRRRT